MSQQDTGYAAAMYSRTELEFELGRMALAITRSGDAGRPDTVTVAWFRDAANRLMQGAAPEHLPFVSRRITELASHSAELRIEGFEQWLAPYRVNWRVTSESRPRAATPRR